MSQSANVFTLFRSLLMAMTTEVHSTYTCRGVKAGGQLLPVSPLMHWEQVSSVYMPQRQKDWCTMLLTTGDATYFCYECDCSYDSSIED